MTPAHTIWLMIRMNDRTKTYLGAFGCLLVAAIWGSAFVFMKDSFDHIAPATFLALRFSLASVVLWLLLGAKRRRLRPRAWRDGALVGLALWGGYYLQTLGLEQTTASNSALITGAYVVFVPLISWCFTRRIQPAQLMIGWITLVAIAIISLDGDFRFGRGELLVLLGSLVYAMHFLLLGHYAPHYDTTLFTTLQITFAAGYNILAALITDPLPHFSQLPATVWGALFFTAVFATALAFFIQTAAQKVLAPAPAAVLFTTECLFGVLFGVLLLNEQLLPRQLLGGAIMLCCILLTVRQENRSQAKA